MTAGGEDHVSLDITIDRAHPADRPQRAPVGGGGPAGVAHQLDV